MSFVQDWDLWGPLILCTFMATILQSHVEAGNHDTEGDGGPEFAEVFVIVWLGKLHILCFKNKEILHSPTEPASTVIYCSTITISLLLLYCCF